jgi:hypothetical protein
LSEAAEESTEKKHMSQKSTKRHTWSNALNGAKYEHQPMSLSAFSDARILPAGRLPSDTPARREDLRDVVMRT